MADPNFWSVVFGCFSQIREAPPCKHERPSLRISHSVVNCGGKGGAASIDINECPIFRGPKTGHSCALSEEMLQETALEPVSAPPQQEFVKVHVVLSKGNDLHPRHWRARCGWNCGRGLTNYSIFDKIPLGQACKVCLLARSQSDGSSSSTSDSSSSSAKSRWERLPQSQCRDVWQLVSN